MRENQALDAPEPLEPDARVSSTPPSGARADEEVQSERGQAITQAASPRRAASAGSPGPAAPKKRKRRRMITMLVIAGIIVGAGLFSLLTLLPSPTPTPLAGIRVGAAAPTFVLPIYGGGGSGSIDLRALRGHPVMINFWSESCPPCLAETPLLEQTAQQYSAQGFVLLGVNQADPQDDIAPFGRHYHITFPLLFDPGGRVNQTYKVAALPTTYFLDRTGIVRAAFVTELTPKTLRQGLASIGVALP